MIINCTGGSGSSGLTLTVQATAAGTITVSNTSLGKSYSKEVASGGTAVFGGLAPATWEVTLSDGSQSTTISVTLESNKIITIAYFSATIVATYPAGSTCTCSDGTTTLTAPDTSGSATFTVPNTGNWTVTATDGSSTTSQAVSITTEGQSESVTLTYELVLFNNGDYAAETGGFTGISNNKLYTKNTGYNGSYTYTPWYSNNAVDITNYSTLKFTVEKGGVTGDDNNYNLLDVGITKTKGTSNTNDLAAKVSVEDNDATADKEYTLDISNFSGTYYIEGISQGGDWTSRAKLTWSNTLRVELS